MATRIVLTVDGSALAERATPVAAWLAGRAGATVVVLRVADEDPVVTAENRDAEHTLAVAQASVEATALRLRASGVEAEAMAVVDRPAEGIVRFVAARRARLLVMATHGRGGLGRLLHGSVAEAVLRRSPVPVVLVRAWEDGAALPPAEAAPVIVVPLDGSPLAEAALPVARRLAELLQAALVLLRVVPVPVTPDRPAGAAAALEVSLLDMEQRAASAYLADRAAALVPAVATTTAVDVGPPADAIVAAARERRAALVVMGTHVHGDVLHTLFGSTAERVVRFGPCPVVLVRASPDAAPPGPAPPTA